MDAPEIHQIVIASLGMGAGMDLNRQACTKDDGLETHGTDFLLSPSFLLTGVVYVQEIIELAGLSFATGEEQRATVCRLCKGCTAEGGD